MNWTILLRWLHVAFGAAWLGEVITVNFVLIPITLRAERSRQRWLMATLYPRVFNLASWFAGGAVVFGALLNLSMTGWRLDWERFTTGRWGWSILIGGILGLALTLFHFFVENRLEPVITEEDTPDEEIDRVLGLLRVVPRVGLGVLVLVFGSMMYAVRGF